MKKIEENEDDLIVKKEVIEKEELDEPFLREVMQYDGDGNLIKDVSKEEIKIKKIL